MPCEHLNFTGRFLWQLLQQCCLININDAPECLLFFSFLHSPSERLLICYRRLFRLDFNHASPITGAGGAGYSAVAVMTWNPHRIQEKKEKKNEHRLVSFGSSFSSAAAAILLALGLLDICPSAVAPVSAVQYTARCVAAAAARCCSYYYSTLPIKNPRESHQLVRPNSLGSELRHKWRSVGYIDNIDSISIFSFFLLHPGERRRRRGRKRFSFPLAFPSV